MASELKYDEMLAQAKKIRDLADSFVSSLEPFASDGSDSEDMGSEDDGYDPSEDASEESDQEGPPSINSNPKHMAIILALKKKFKK